MDEMIENVLSELKARSLDALDDCPVQHLERSKKRVAHKGDCLTEETEIFFFLYAFFCSCIPSIGNLFLAT
jgi:hypothetical protein